VLSVTLRRRGVAGQDGSRVAEAVAVGVAVEARRRGAVEAVVGVVDEGVAVVVEAVADLGGAGVHGAGVVVAVRAVGGVARGRAQALGGEVGVAVGVGVAVLVVGG
jgi:hypothetical protein